MSPGLKSTNLYGPVPTGLRMVGPERRRLFERHLDAVAVELLDLAVLVAADRRRGDRRIAGVFPVEDAVVGAERLAVVPGHVALELPGHRQAVGREAAVLARRDLGREHREEIAVRIPAGERLVEDARAVLVLGADREMRVEQRSTLPPEHLEGAAAAALRRLVGDLLLLLCPRRAAEGEHLARERRRDTERHHPPDERPPRQLAVLYAPDEPPQLLLVHDPSSRSVLALASRGSSAGTTGCVGRQCRAWRQARPITGSASAAPARRPAGAGCRPPGAPARPRSAADRSCGRPAAHRGSAGGSGSPTAASSGSAPRPARCAGAPCAGSDRGSAPRRAAPPYRGGAGARTGCACRSARRSGRGTSPRCGGSRAASRRDRG